MRKLLVLPRARTDLLDIWHYISRDDPKAADRVLTRIETAISGLVSTPGKGHWRADVRDREYRFWTVFSYVIAYRYDESSLTVVRVVHGRRDFRKLFG